MKLRLIMLCLLSATVTLGWAEDFYVSSVHSSRSDNNSGTSASAPWATIDKVKQNWGSTITAGDTVHLERGSTWNVTGSPVSWQITSGGDAANGPITVRGDMYGSGPDPIIQKTGGAIDDRMIWVTGSASFITLRNFTIDGGTHNGVGASGIYVGGPSQTANIEHVDVLNMTVRNLGNSTTAYNCGIWYSAWNNRTISNCLIEGNDVSGYTKHGLNHYPHRASQTTANTHHNMIWRNNRVHDLAAVYEAGGGDGLHIAYGGSGNIFEYNYIDGPNMHASILISAGPNNDSGIVIRHNVLKDNSLGPGLRVFGGPPGPSGTTMSADVYGNIIIGCSEPGFLVQSYSYFNGTFRLYNNTFYGNNQEGLYNGDIALSSNNDHLTVDLRNNIFAYTEANGSPLYTSSGFNGALTHLNNLYWNAAGSGGRAVNDKWTLYSVAQVDTFEPTAQNADPLFVDVSRWPTAVSSDNGVNPDGLAIQQTSPAVNSGADLGAPYGTSINLYERPYGGGWDIGAFEFGVPVDVPSPPSGLTALGS